MSGRFFGEQATRLLRETWGSPDELAEELYAMATATGPLVTDQPMQLTTNGNQPAITIFDNGNGSVPPIQIIRSGDPNMPQSTCCSGSVGTQGSNAGGGGSPRPPTTPTAPDTGVPPGSLTPDIPPGTPGPGTPYREFYGGLGIQLHMTNDSPFWPNNSGTSFGCFACLPYQPPLIPAPGTAWAFACVVEQLNEFLGSAEVAPYLIGYKVISDDVTPPRDPCTPSS